MKTILTVFVSLFVFTASQAQKISGEVKDVQGKAISNATISLKKASDSSLVKMAVSSGGKYEFNNIKEGRYFVTISNVGYGNSNSPAFDVSGNGEVTVPSVWLSKTAGQLKDVVVSAKKPIIEVKADKTVFNVESSINATGTDALDLLRKSPGVMVDKDDNINLAGKNGVQVYIDGKPSPLSGKDLADYLRSLQSSSIEAIEIIVNPSAKYDAAGNAGIINIKLKKNKSMGANGSVNAGYNIGIYAKYNGGISLNYRNKNVNLFGNYSYNHNLSENSLNIYRKVSDSIFDQRTRMMNDNNSHNFKAGVDFFIDKKSTFGVMVNGNLADANPYSNSRNYISSQTTGDTSRLLVANNSSTTSNHNLNANLNYRFANTTGYELNIDADYGNYRNRSNQLQPNYYYTPDGATEIERRIYNMISPTDINLYTLKADYEQNFLKGRLGFGGKSAFIKTTNNFERYNVVSNSKTLDTLKSNNFNYKENINAAYINYNKQFKKGIMVQFGVRMEDTHSEGTSQGFTHNGTTYVGYDSTFKRDYIDFFPSAAVTFNKNPMSQWGLSYSRRIDRPAYQDLNPFEFKLDEYSYMKGNTNLRPQYTNSFGLTHSYKYTLNTRFNYSHVTDVFTQLVDTAEKTKSFLTKKNLATQDIFSLNESYFWQKKWYSFFGNLNAFYSHYKADFGTGRKIDVDVYSASLYMQNTFKLGHDWTAELSGWGTLPSLWSGTFKSKSMGGLDIGLQKLILQKKGTIKVSFTDIFHTMKWRGSTDFAGQTVQAQYAWEAQQFKLNFSYRFGRSQVKAARQRSTGAEEEKNRTQGSGGLGN